MSTPMTNQGKLRGTEATRAELLEIGLGIVLERGLPVGLNIRVAEVVERAGRSLGSAYQIWDNQEHFREDLAVYLARSTGHTSLQRVMPDITASIERGDSIHEMAHSVGTTFFRLLIGSPNFFVSRHFWTVAQPVPPEIHEALADTSLEVQKEIEALFTMLLDHFGRRVKDRYVLQDLCRMIIATADGLALESRFPTHADNSDTHTQLFADSLVLFIDSCTEPKSA